MYTIVAILATVYHVLHAVYVITTVSGEPNLVQKNPSRCPGASDLPYSIRILDHALRGDSLQRTSGRCGPLPGGQHCPLRHYAITHYAIMPLPITPLPITPLASGLVGVMGD